MQVFSHGVLVLVLDCSDLDRSAAFWSRLLGYRRSEPGDGPYRSLTPSTEGAPELLLQRVGETKTGKNRLHLDLRVADLDAEVARALTAGATLVTATPLVEDGWRWHVLADPDGNEFCVLEAPDRP